MSHFTVPSRTPSIRTYVFDRNCRLGVHNACIRKYNRASSHHIPRIRRRSRAFSTPLHGSNHAAQLGIELLAQQSVGQEEQAGSEPQSAPLALEAWPHPNGRIGTASMA